MKNLDLKQLDNYPDRKFIDTLNVDEWEVETEDGWKDIQAIGKTIKYDVWELILENNLSLKGADNHIIIKKENDFFKECFLKDIQKGDRIFTKKGITKVKSIEKLNYKENMYDMEIDSENKTYYTNDILSHNSLWMQNLAAKSVLGGHNTAYITLELQEEMVNMRIGSNMLNIDINEYETVSEDTAYMKDKINKLKAGRPNELGKLYVKEFPSSTMSANDLVTHLKKAEEILGYKFENVFIDYINIMKNWRNPNTENTYIKIKQISEDLRAGAQEGDWTFITVTQTGRQGWEASDVMISDVAESAALIHTVDALFGIITGPEMKANNEYLLKYLADRVSGMENTRKRFEVNWKYGRIEEDRNRPIEDMNFAYNSLVSGRKQNSYKNKSTGGDRMSLETAVGTQNNANSENNETTIEDVKSDINNHELFK
ncbi:MAG: DnaB-like helicase C-terminal domain-containing protein [bacterium]